MEDERPEMPLDHFPEYVDSSMVEVFKKCPMKFYYEHICHWKPKVVSVHLHAGAVYARGLEVARTLYYVNGQSVEAAMKGGREALAEAYGDFECPPHEAKTKDRMLTAFDFYWLNYPLNDADAPIVLPDGRRAIEFSFSLPIPVLHPATKQPMIYCGRFDTILNYRGLIMGEDDKTTKSLGATWVDSWDLRSQFTGYGWAAQESGIKVDGFLIRGVSILKTKHETQQAITYRPEWQIERWLGELCVWVEMMKNCFRTGIWLHALGDACTDFGGCAFRRPCLYQDDNVWLEQGFEKRRWNPLVRQEEAL